MPPIWIVARIYSVQLEKSKVSRWHSLPSIWNGMTPAEIPYSSMAKSIVDTLNSTMNNCVFHRALLSLNSEVMTTKPLMKIMEASTFISRFRRPTNVSVWLKPMKDRLLSLVCSPSLTRASLTINAQAMHVKGRRHFVLFRLTTMVRTFLFDLFLRA